MTVQEFLLKQKMAQAQQQQAYANTFAGGLGGWMFGSFSSQMGNPFTRAQQAQPKPKDDASVIQMTKQPDGSYSVPLSLT